MSDYGSSDVPLWILIAGQTACSLENPYQENLDSDQDSQREGSVQPDPIDEFDEEITELSARRDELIHYAAQDTIHQARTNNIELNRCIKRLQTSNTSYKNNLANCSDLITKLRRERGEARDERDHAKENASRQQIELEDQMRRERETFISRLAESEDIREKQESDLRELQNAKVVDFERNRTELQVLRQQGDQHKKDLEEQFGQLKLLMTKHQDEKSLWVEEKRSLQARLEKTEAMANDHIHPALDKTLAEKEALQHQLDENRKETIRKNQELGQLQHELSALTLSSLQSTFLYSTATNMARHETQDALEQLESERKNCNQKIETQENESRKLRETHSRKILELQAEHQDLIKQSVTFTKSLEEEKTKLAGENKDFQCKHQQLTKKVEFWKDLFGAAEHCRATLLELLYTRLKFGPTEFDGETFNGDFHQRDNMSISESMVEATFERKTELSKAWDLHEQLQDSKDEIRGRLKDQLALMTGLLRDLHKRYLLDKQTLQNRIKELEEDTRSMEGDLDLAKKTLLEIDEAHRTEFGKLNADLERALYTARRYKSAYTTAEALLESVRPLAIETQSERQD